MNVNPNPFFSIIIATYNAALYIDRAVTSLFSQKGDFTYELIIIDGKSIDNTIEIINKYKEKISYLESSADSGIYDAWNKALKHTKGEWLYFLGADDYFYDEEALLRVFEQLKNFSGSYIAYGIVNSIDVKNKLCRSHNIHTWKYIKNLYLQFNCLHHQGVFHHKKFFQTYGNFDVFFKIAGDYEILLRYLKYHEPLEMKIVVAYAGIGGISNNINFGKKTVREFLVARRKNGDKTLGYIWMFNYFKENLKYIFVYILGAALMEKILLFYRKYLYLMFKKRS